MNRFVLAILALLAGLVSQTAPAHARFSAGSGAQVTVQVPGSNQVAIPAARAGCKPQVAHVLRSVTNSCALPQRAPKPSTVEIGSDRSRQ